MAEYGGETNGGGLQYLTANHLGSTRLVTNATAGAVCRLDYLPFGEEIQAGVGGRSASWNDCSGPGLKFTGKERGDLGSENSLDYFGARYFSGAQGRYISPDWAEQPEAVPYAEFADPQTLNLYAYARNNPLTLTDPDGHFPWVVVIGGAGGAAAYYITQKLIDQPVTVRGLMAAGVGGAITGATFGHATAPTTLTSAIAGTTTTFKTGVALRLAAAAISGIPGGVVSRAIETNGDPGKAIGILEQVGSDVGTSLMSEGGGALLAPVVKSMTTAGRAVAVGEAKIARGTKPSPNLPRRQAELETQQKVVGAAAGAIVDILVKTKQKSTNCTTYGDCSQLQ